MLFISNYYVLFLNRFTTIICSRNQSVKSFFDKRIKISILPKRYTYEDLNVANGRSLFEKVIQLQFQFHA